MSIPVALIIFNRPNLTERVFKEISKTRPSKLFIIADGPRIDYPEDIEKCAETRAVVEQVDWDCEVFKKYSDINLGCGHGPAGGISWVFEHVESAIILEDDCIPSTSFFRYCEELLAQYRDDDRVMMVSGRNHLGIRDVENSYYFNNIGSTWGWATWRRAWKYYDIKVRLWPILRETTWLEDILGDPRAVVHWSKIFEKAYKDGGDVDYWDYQWSFACWAQNGLAITPKVNLITNIGFGEIATHTTYALSPHRYTHIDEMEFPLQHPAYMARDKEAEMDLIDNLLGPTDSYKKIEPKQSLMSRVRGRLSTVTPDPLRKQVRSFLSKLESR